VPTVAVQPRQTQRSPRLEVLLVGFVLGSLALAAPPVRVGATLGSLVHELGHATTATLLGQHVSFVVNRHGLGLSGLPTNASRWGDVLVLSAGYLGPPFAAAALIVASARPRAARAAALALAVAIALGLAVWTRPRDAGLIGLRDGLSPTVVLAVWFVIAVPALWFAVNAALRPRRPYG
jgi:hypothetical protein